MSIWNVDSLLAHILALLDKIEQRFVGLLGELEKRIIGLLAELEKRIEASRITMEKRLEGMNEFRQSNLDQADRSPTRAEVNAKFESYDKELKVLNDFKSSMEGKASVQDVNSARIGSYIAIALAVLGLVLRIFGI